MSSVRAFQCSTEEPLCCSVPLRSVGRLLPCLLLLSCLLSLPDLLIFLPRETLRFLPHGIDLIKAMRATPWNESFICMAETLLPHLPFFFFHFSFVSPFYVRPVPKTIGSVPGSSVAVPWCLTGSLFKPLANYSSRCHCIASLLSA